MIHAHDYGPMHGVYSAGRWARLLSGSHQLGGRPPRHRSPRLHGRLKGVALGSEYARLEAGLNKSTAC